VGRNASETGAGIVRALLVNAFAQAAESRADTTQRERRTYGIAVSLRNRTNELAGIRF